MGPDYDDVGAITLLHALADSNQARILATIASTRYNGVASVLSVFNTYFNRPDVPVGVTGKNGLDISDGQHWSDTVRKNYTHALQSNEDAVDATTLYRRILSEQPDNSVTIITVGFLTNLSNLITSVPDKFSGLNGLELVKKKVKLLVSMAGTFPTGREFNIHRDALSARQVFEKWPVPVIFSGFEIGQKIKTGLPLIQNTNINNSPVKDVFRISVPLAKNDSAGRMSWDQTAVLVAIKGYSPFYSLQPGTIIINDDGSNKWVNSGKKHAYLVAKADPGIVENYINKLMQHQPVKKQ
jgi:inosine-uridine nucleoside N-ribohydrolase